MSANEPGLVAVKHVFAGAYAPGRRAGCPAPARRHPFTVLAYQVAGELEVEHGGHLTLRAGDLHVIPAGHAHGIRGGRDAEVWSVAVREGTLDPSMHAAVLEPLERIANGALPRVMIRDERRAFVTALFAELAREGQAGPARHASLVVLLLAELLEHTAGSSAATLPPGTRGGADLVARVIAFVAANALSPLSLEDVARGVGRSRTHVADVVRRSTGQSVGALITGVRLEEAQRRLIETDELVEVIGERVGYRDPTHFARVFKRRFGAAPRSWRVSNRAQIT